MFICDNVIPHEQRPGDKLLTKYAFKPIDYFVVQSKNVADDLEKFNVNSKPVLLTHHPLYDNYGEKQGLEDSRKFLSENYNVKIDTNDDVILFFGYIRKYKGLDVLLKAIPLVNTKHNVKLVIAGEFYDDEEKYMQSISELNSAGNIFLVKDFIPNDDVKYFFSACDLVVLPYHHATQSGIIPVAYYYDKPVLVTNVGALPEVVDDEKTGYVVPTNDPESLASAVIRFFQSGQRTGIESNILHEKKKYSWESFTESLIEFVNSK
jgi:Glycosyltransferase